MNKSELKLTVHECCCAAVCCEIQLLRLLCFIWHSCTPPWDVRPLSKEVTWKLRNQRALCVSEGGCSVCIHTMRHAFACNHTSAFYCDKGEIAI